MHAHSNGVGCGDRRAMLYIIIPGISLKWQTPWRGCRQRGLAGGCGNSRQNPLARRTTPHGTLSSLGTQRKLLREWRLAALYPKCTRSSALGKRRKPRDVRRMGRDVASALSPPAGKTSSPSLITSIRLKAEKGKVR